MAAEVDSMLTFLPGSLKGAIAATLFVLNTLFWCTLLYPFIALKTLIPHRGLRRWCTRVMIHLAENWITGNSLEMALMHKIDWEIQGREGLDPNKSYLVSANHQSWVDIVILQHVFNRRIPFLRFFLKQELIWVPLLGGAWWGLDFPFMKRYSKSYLEKHPEKRGKDLETTRKACERFRDSKITVLNFLEGTRFTHAKHQKQKSPYQNLLSPKTGGIAFVLEAMGRQFDSILDVTILYPGGPVSLWGLFSGRCHKVIVHIREVAIPLDLLQGNYLEDSVFREKMQAWVRDIWAQKDQLIANLKVQHSIT